MSSAHTQITTKLSSNVTVLIKSENIQQRKSRFQTEKNIIKCRNSNAIRKNNFSTMTPFMMPLSLRTLSTPVSNRL